LVEAAAAVIDLHLGPRLDRVAFDKADEIGELLGRAMGDHRHGLARAPGGLALLRLGHDVADEPRTVLRLIRGPGAALAKRLRRAPFWRGRFGRSRGGSGRGL